MSIPIGYQGKLSEGGVPTTLTDEATTQVGTSKTYQITNAAKRVLDPATAIVVKENGAASSAANIVNVNALTGEVTFIAAHSPAAPVTLSGKYVPVAAVASVAEVSSNPKLNTADSGLINSSGMEMRAPTTMDWDGDFKLLEVLSEQGFGDLLTGRTPVLLEVDHDGTGAAVTRGWALLTGGGGGIKQKEIVSSDVKFTLYDQSRKASALSGFRVDAGVAFFTS